MSKPFSFLDINWFCEQAYDPQTGYDIPYFRPTVDETVRVQGLLSQDVRVVGLHNIFCHVYYLDSCELVDMDVYVLSF